MSGIIHVWLNQLPGFIVGAVVGTSLGWYANARRDARRSGERVDRSKLALLLVVALSVYSSVVAQVSFNQRGEDDKNRDQETACTSTVLFQLSSAIDTRTQLSGSQAAANIEAWKAQLRLLTSNLSTVTPEQGARMLATYVAAIKTFLSIATDSAATNKVTPYPDPDVYAKCLKEARN